MAHTGGSGSRIYINQLLAQHPTFCFGVESSARRQTKAWQPSGLLIRYHSSVRRGLQRHSMCLKCFRKRWPHGKYSPYQVPASLRAWQVCCFCLTKHKDALYLNREPGNRELKCGGKCPLVSTIM
jgi:hypothetical protein